MNMLTSSQAERRDWYLNQLHIKQYAVRKPQLLGAALSLDITPDLRLLVVTENAISFDAFFTDIVSAVGLTAEVILFINPEQIALLPDNLRVVLWLIDVDSAESDQPNAAALITTPSLTQLKTDANAKRQLWQQLCHYERYFHP